MNGTGVSRVRLGWIVLAYGLALFVLLAPLALSVVPPLIDYPNHLAKIHIAASLPENSHLARFYEWRLRLVPNLAQDLIVPPLARLFGTYAAMKLFLGWSMVQLLAGTCLLRYALIGRVGLWPLACVLFLFNQVLWWGFLNFLFTAGLVLLLFALWILLARRGPAIRVLLFTVLMPLIFFCHLIAAAILTACIGSFQLQRIWTALKPDPSNPANRSFALREVVVTAIPMVPLPILWFLSPTGSNERLFIHTGILNLVEALLSPFTMSGTTWGYAFGLVVLGLAVLAYATRQIALVGSLWLTASVLGMIAILMPQEVLGVYGTHFRVPFLLGCILVAGLQVHRPKPIFAMTAAMTIATLFVLRGADLVHEWRRFDVRMGQYRAALDKIPAGAKVVTVLDHPGAQRWSGAVDPKVFWHLSALVVVEASAFDPMLFSSPIRQSVAVRESMRHLDVPLGRAMATVWASRAYRAAQATAKDGVLRKFPPWQGRDWSRWFEEFDYVVRLSYKKPRDVLSGPVKSIASGDWFDLYRIERPEAGPRP